MAAKRSEATLMRIQRALGLASRRARDAALHEHLGERVGYRLEGPYYATIARLRLTDGLTVTELADQLGMEVSTVSRRINALEARGLVQREAGTHDRRTAYPRLTEDGQHAAAILESGWRDLLAEVLAGWSTADLSAFADLFERFADAFDTYARTEMAQPLPLPRRTAAAAVTTRHP
jgi:DNA-binding MarR family transcriptional regulator